MMCLSRKCAEPNRSSPRTTTTMLNWEEGKKKRNLEDKKKQNKQKEKKLLHYYVWTWLSALRWATNFIARAMTNSAVCC